MGAMLFFLHETPSLHGVMPCLNIYEVERWVWTLWTLVVTDSLILLFVCFNSFVSQESFVARSSVYRVRRSCIVASKTCVRIRSFNNIGAVSVDSPVAAVETDCVAFSSCVVRAVVALSAVPNDRVASGSSCNSGVL